MSFIHLFYISPPPSPGKKEIKNLNSTRIEKKKFTLSKMNLNECINECIIKMNEPLKRVNLIFLKVNLAVFYNDTQNNVDRKNTFFHFSL